MQRVDLPNGADPQFAQEPKAKAKRATGSANAGRRHRVAGAVADWLLDSRLAEAAGARLDAARRWGPNTANSGKEPTEKRPGRVAPAVARGSWKHARLILAVEWEHCGWSRPPPRNGLWRRMMRGCSCGS